MKLKTGQSLTSATDSTTVIVISAVADEVSLTCGGVEMVEPGTAADKKSAVAGSAGETLLGKRYVDEAGLIEVLCTKAGETVLALDGTALTIKAAKALPSSD